MKFIFIFLFLLSTLLTHPCIAQPKVSNADIFSLSKKIKHEGTIVKAIEWSEKKKITF